MDSIIISDLEVWYHVGVPAEERVKAQRLLLTVELRHDFTKAAANDSLDDTINYFAVCQRLLRLGEGREWKLLERLAGEIVTTLLAEYPAAEVTVEIKKFIIPETRHVAVRSSRRRD